MTTRPTRRRLRLAVVEQPVAGRAATVTRRVLLAVLVAIAGLLYGWNASGNLEIFYAAAVRSMSSSWRDFFFAAFDPKGTITIDKLPGAFWLQALSVRIFGVHPWALVAPQVVEGMAAVVVMYRVAARTIGANWGLLAAALLVVDPAVVALDRGNISDTLMILLLLLAANSTVSAVLSSRFHHLLLAGLWVGLAFQAKMLEAWLVLPALGLAYLLASPSRPALKWARLVLAGVVTAVVSLSWMAVVSLFPKGSRPYVDGSQNDSLFSQVFVYNGFGRTDTATPNQILSKTIGLKLPTQPVTWHRLLSGPDALVGAWLLPAAAIALVACLVFDRDRRSARYGATVMWGLWLVVLFFAFTLGQSINSYYTAALIPPAAGLIATGVRLAWTERARLAVRVGAGLTAVATAAYALWLMPGHGLDVSVGYPVLALVLAGAGTAVLAAGGVRSRVVTGGLALCVLGLVTVPVAGSTVVVSNHLGPFDTPFESHPAYVFNRQLGAVAKVQVPLLPKLYQAQFGAPWLMATQTSAVAAPFIFDTGLEVLPIGGYSGSIPSPTLAQIKRYVADQDFHLVIQSPNVTDPRLKWIAGHCRLLSNGNASKAPSGNLRVSIYFCGL